MPYREDSEVAVRLCAGSCGRMTRPYGQPAREGIETVTRSKKGFCRECWAKQEAERELTPKEKEAKRLLELYIQRRRQRIGLKSGLEQFRTTPIFGTLASIRDQSNGNKDGTKADNNAS